MVELDNEVEVVMTRAVQSNAGGSLWKSCVGRAGGSDAPNSLVISGGGYFIVEEEGDPAIVSVEADGPLDSPPPLFLFFPRRALRDQVFSPAWMTNSMGCGTSSPCRWDRNAFSFSFGSCCCSPIRSLAMTSRTSRPATFKRTSFNVVVKSCTSILGRHA